MASVQNKWLEQSPLLRGLLLALLLPGTPALAQAPLPSDDGLKGEYYEGTNFEKLVLTRRDATINFNWGQQPPAPGLPAEMFSVRWTGWLVPPASGKYVFHVTVDDGIRLWLNDRLLMNEWRGQSISNYTVAVELRAGEPYHLRVDYCQYGLDTRVFITWEQPDSQIPPPPSSWRNLWGMTADKPGPEPIAARFLFNTNPRAVAPRAAAPKPPTPPAPSLVIVVPPTVAPARRKALPPPAPALRPRLVAPTAAPLPPATAAPVRSSIPSLLLADSGSTNQLMQLAAGETVTLPELRFDQGQARLLPAARTALDKLAIVLHAQPTLQVEVQGHTDNVGNAELNRQLSQQRAEAVCLYLTAHGVSTVQLRPRGYGGTQPVADNADPNQRPRNRRVVLRRL